MKNQNLIRRDFQSFFFFFFEGSTKGTVLLRAGALIWGWGLWTEGQGLSAGVGVSALGRGGGKALPWGRGSAVGVGVCIGAGASVLAWQFLHWGRGSCVRREDAPGVRSASSRQRWLKGLC